MCYKDITRCGRSTERQTLLEQERRGRYSCLSRSKFCLDFAGVEGIPKQNLGSKLNRANSSHAKMTDDGLNQPGMQQGMQYSIVRTVCAVAEISACDVIHSYCTN